MFWIENSDYEFPQGTTACGCYDGGSALKLRSPWFRLWPICIIFLWKDPPVLRREGPKMRGQSSVQLGTLNRRWTLPCGPRNTTKRVNAWTFVWTVVVQRRTAKMIRLQRGLSVYLWTKWVNLQFPLQTQRVNLFQLWTQQSSLQMLLWVNFHVSLCPKWVALSQSERVE